MKVFKFGGASVRDADSVRNLTEIVKKHQHERLLIVISAMGKTTNALEKIAWSYFQQSANVTDLLNDLKNQHDAIIRELFNQQAQPVLDEINNTFIEIEWMLEDEPQDDFDFIYDQIVSVGELVSTKIISTYLNHLNIANKWLDARNYIQTDNSYREAKIDWKRTCGLIQEEIPEIINTQLAITQGFIGNTSENFTTTLGREGSDFTAAIFASCLNAESVTVWKDVPGILNADPKIYENTVLIEEISYADAMEMTYFGATVIHPKTIKPLQNKGIPLLVKSFMDINQAGTMIKQEEVDVKTPVVIVKTKQILMSLSYKDHSFINESHLAELFGIFHTLHIKINVMQLSALSFTVCFDENPQRFEQLTEKLSIDYHYKYNQDLKLLTIRHATTESIRQYIDMNQLVLEQRSRHTAQFVLKESK